MPMIASICSLCCLQVPVAIILSGTKLGYNGIWIAAPIGWFGGLLIRAIYFYHVSKKEKTIKIYIKNFTKLESMDKKLMWQFKQQLSAKNKFVLRIKRRWIAIAYCLHFIHSMDVHHIKKRRVVGGIAMPEKT